MSGEAFGRGAASCGDVDVHAMSGGTTTTACRRWLGAPPQVRCNPFRTDR
eukprot:CAMPEP_0115873040 /NCGR_PEP_ID=MMETSP0287-20121206/23767_1 /TAXON_ID=412157 /ORGANISM="Chrysochromulina rotalis, Strain UIO044" /LENGTH=49 /DNA_ID=CAMNT_0003328041 /DNA_START=338 /DNA_END=487 /DNA_ORIENTATION=-